MILRDKCERDLAEFVRSKYLPECEGSCDLCAAQLAMPIDQFMAQEWHYHSPVYWARESILALRGGKP